MLLMLLQLKPLEIEINIIEKRGGGGGAGKGGGKGCFVKGTMIEMADGTEKEITTITVGESN